MIICQFIRATYNFKWSIWICIKYIVMYLAYKIIHWLLMCIRDIILSPNLLSHQLCSTSYWVQIFCLINCAPLHAPPINFGQLASLIKWNNSDFNTHVTETLTLKSLSFFFLFFLPRLYFFSVPAFGFFFFSSPCVVWLLPQLLGLIWTLPLFCLIVILSLKVKVRLLLLFLFLYDTEVLFSYKCRFFSTFERLLLQQATSKACTRIVQSQSKSSSFGLM